MPPDENVHLAASIILRYCPKCAGELELLARHDTGERLITAENPASEDTVKAYAVE
jgi:hypothetical protein